MKKISHEDGMENDSWVISKGFTEEVICDQKPQWWVDPSLGKIWEMNVLGQGNSEGERYEGEVGQCVWGPDRRLVE